MSITVSRTAPGSASGHPTHDDDWHTFEELLFQLGFGDLDLDRLVHLLCVSPLVVGVVLDCSGEQGVDEGSLSKSRLASNLTRSVWVRPVESARADHDGEGSTSLGDDLVSLVGQVGDTYRRCRLGRGVGHVGRHSATRFDVGEVRSVLSRT